MAVTVPSWVRSPHLNARWHLAPFTSRKGEISPLSRIAHFAKAGERALRAFPAHPRSTSLGTGSCPASEESRCADPAGRVVTQELHCSTLHQLSQEHLPAAPRVAALQALHARFHRPEQQLSEKVLPDITIYNRLLTPMAVLVWFLFLDLAINTLMNF